MAWMMPRYTSKTVSEAASRAYATDYEDLRGNPLGLPCCLWHGYCQTATGTELRNDFAKSK
jgi:hypothetical protein